MSPESTNGPEQAQAETLARAMLLMIEKAAGYRKRCELLELEVKSLVIETQRLRARLTQYEADEVRKDLDRGAG